MFRVSSKQRRLATPVRLSRVARRLSSVWASFRHRHVAQRLDDGDELAGFVVNGARVDGQVEPGAHLRHDAPVFRAAAMRCRGVARGVVPVGVELVDFFGAAQREQVGQAGARFIVEAAPVFAGADDLAGLDAGQPLASAVPDEDAAVGVDDEGRHDQVLHQPDGKIHVANIMILNNNSMPRRHGDLRGLPIRTRHYGAQGGLLK